MSPYQSMRKPSTIADTCTSHFHPNPQPNLQTMKKESKESHNLVQTPIYQKRVATNIGRAFLKLLDVEFPNVCFI